MPKSNYQCKTMLPLKKTKAYRASQKIDWLDRQSEQFPVIQYPHTCHQCTVKCDTFLVKFDLVVCMDTLLFMKSLQLCS
jgi:hypothetical protein